MKQIIALTLGLMLMTVATTASAQKFGFCNSVEILSLLPEVKQADSDLQALQTQMTKKGQEMVKELQDEAATLQRKQEQGTISPKDYETEATKLKEKEANLQKYEQEIYAKLGAKREELYKPIFDKVNKAMQEAAKESGYQMVFDSNTQVLLYADETLNITKLVKAKLGIAN